MRRRRYSFCCGDFSERLEKFAVLTRAMIASFMLFHLPLAAASFSTNWRISLSEPQETREEEEEEVDEEAGEESNDVGIIDEEEC